MLLERYSNSGRFKSSLQYLMKVFELAPHAFYLKLVDDYREKGLLNQPLGMAAAYDALYAFALDNNISKALFSDLLKFDYHQSNMKGRRPFFEEPEIKGFNAMRLRFLQDSDKLSKMNAAYTGLSGKEILKSVNIVAFKYDIISLIDTNFEVLNERLSLVLFDYAVPTGSIASAVCHGVNEMLECE
jgi:hypothetical protein